MEFLKNNKEAITALGVLATFIISCFSLYYTRKNNKSSHYINTITKNRVDWIYKLRDLISEYISITSMGTYRQFVHDEKELSEHFERIKKLNVNIRLFLNYTGRLDKKLMNDINTLEELSIRFYQLLFISEQIMDEDKSIEEKDDLIATSDCLREYVIEYLNTQGMKIAYDKDSITSSFIIKDRIKKLREDRKLESWDLGVFFQCKGLLTEINNIIIRIERNSQIYLKFEWNRVKFEAQGNEYPKNLQEFDLIALEELYDNPNYIVNRTERNRILGKLWLSRSLKNKMLWFILIIIIMAALLIA